MSDSSESETVLKVCILFALLSFVGGMVVGSAVSSPPECVSTVTDMASDPKAKERVYSCKRHDQKMTIDVIENGMRVICACKEK